MEGVKIDVNGEEHILKPTKIICLLRSYAAHAKVQPFCCCFVGKN